MRFGYKGDFEWGQALTSSRDKKYNIMVINAEGGIKQLNRKTRSLVILIVFILILAIVSYIAIAGLNIGIYVVKPLGSAIKQGLDLSGGVYLVYEAQVSDNEPDLDSKIDGVIGVFRNRLDSKGLTEATIAKQGERRIRVEIPGTTDLQEAQDLLGRTAKLEFKDEAGNVIITGSDVRSAKPEYGADDTGITQPVVALELNDEGAKKFAEGTRANLGKTISIVLDDQVISSPMVKNEIPNGKAQITGMASMEEAANLANLIQSGALPVPVEVIEMRSIKATLGAGAMERSVLAGAIGVAAVLLFMLLYYRLPGLVADIALVTYILLVFLVLAGTGATLTLPGIAGIVLSIGMAVDANVLIFERLKEELKSGKTLGAAVDAGFHRALSAILDSNITTIIAGVVLLVYGTGTIKGFAVTLIIGIIVSMFTAVVVTRYLLKLVMDFGIKNLKVYGVKEVAQ
ncbi:MAG: preprotein translocase subunit SecD [Clostridiales bacterium]|jgi:protein-export SecD/SecF family membrane protein|nr:preprotein translocase subunit SecD [Clostridiales bacterium]